MREEREWKGLCIGGPEGGKWATHKHPNFRIARRGPLRSVQATSIARAQPFEPIVDEMYFYEEFCFRKHVGTSVTFSYWRHESLIDDGAVLKELFQNYNPVQVIEG